MTSRCDAAWSLSDMFVVFIFVNVLQRDIDHPHMSAVGRPVVVSVWVTAVSPLANIHVVASNRLLASVKPTRGSVVQVLDLETRRLVVLKAHLINWGPLRATGWWTLRFGSWAPPAGTAVIYLMLFRGKQPVCVCVCVCVCVTVGPLVQYTYVTSTFNLKVI